VKRVSVVGLGKLGLCSAVCFAARGLDVVGVDVRADIVDAVNDGRAPFYEPRLQETLESAGPRLRATQDYRRALNESEATFLIVPTPSQPDGHFSWAYLQEALLHLGGALRESGKESHLFGVTSTVSPGTTERHLIPLLEERSRRKLNDGFRMCYNPEFIALGSVISDFLAPDLVLIGESDAEAGDALERLYRRVCENTPHIARMSIMSAEIAKISLNAFLTMKISFANTLASICEAIPGADADAIGRAIGADRRVSPYFLKGGLPFGGPCFPRDNRAFAAFARPHNVEARLADATDEINRGRASRLAALVTSLLGRAHDRTVAVLGVAYKHGTPVIEESPGAAIVDELLNIGGVRVLVYDPLAMDAARLRFGDRVVYATSLRDAVGNAALCLVATPADEFRGIDDTFITRNPTTIVDCWRILDAARLGGRVTYVPLGKHVPLGMTVPTA
jgi:UDPglucose 6-dehydrogenase